MSNNTFALNIPKLKENLHNDQDIFVEIAKAMCDDIVQRGARLNRAVQSRDASVARQEAHAFRGGLGSVTATTAAGLAAELEHMAIASEWGGFDTKLALFNTELKRVSKEFEDELVKLAL